MKATPARLRLAVSPMMVAVALGLLSPNALADDSDKDVEETEIKPTNAKSPAETSEIQIGDTEIFNMEAAGGFDLSSEAELELLSKLRSH